MSEDAWIKNHMVEQAGHTATIINELKTGAARMTSMEKTLGEVVDATREFPAMKMSIKELEAEREKVEQEKFATLTMQLAKKEEQEEKKKVVWNERIWNLCVKLSTPVLIFVYVVYSLAKDEF